MLPKPFFLCLALICCISCSDHKPLKTVSHNDSILPSYDPADTVTEEDNKNGKADTAAQISFWQTVAKPILEKDKKKVLARFDFPVAGDWTYMVGLKKEAEKATKADFLKHYNKFFNEDFIAALSAQSFTNVNVSVANDTTWCTLAVGRKHSEGESSVLLSGFRKNRDFRIKLIFASGGNFYESQR